MILPSVALDRPREDLDPAATSVVGNYPAAGTWSLNLSRMTSGSTNHPIDHHRATILRSPEGEQKNAKSGRMIRLTWLAAKYMVEVVTSGWPNFSSRPVDLHEHGVIAGASYLDQR